MATTSRSRDLVYYKNLWETMVILPEYRDSLEPFLKIIIENKDRYVAVQERTGVPWWYIAGLHYRESDNDFRRQLHNGEPWSQRTKKVPKGVGPFGSWEEAAVDALKGISNVSDWNIATALRRAEGHNGWGYRKRGKNSPYLWAGTNHGIGAGKFLADGVYSSGAVDKDCGVALLWRVLEEGTELVYVYDSNGKMRNERARVFQMNVNFLCNLKRKEFHDLKEDGWLGAKTSDAVYELTGKYLPGDPRESNSQVTQS